MRLYIIIQQKGEKKRSVVLVFTLKENQKLLKNKTLNIACF